MADLGVAAQNVAANIRRIRDGKGISTTRMEAELSKRGQPIPATGITRIEKLQRRVDVDELVALAAVLAVEPSALLLPPGEGDRGSGIRASTFATELLDAVRDVVDPPTGTDVAARARTARRLMAQLALELDEIDDNQTTTTTGS